MKVNIVIPVSRFECVKQVIDNINNLDCDASETGILLYVDGPHHLFQTARNMAITTKFKEKLIYFRAKGIGTVSSMIRRRQRIADMHNEMKKFINKCDYVFLVEDDTLLPKDALTKLLQGFEKYPDAGFVSGVQVGRWGFEMLGAWRTDNAFEPEQITSTKLEEGIQEVDGAGFYCCLVRKENYIDHNFAPFEKILGADVNFGFSLRKKGLKNYVDYSIHCDHVTKKEVLSVDTAKIVQVEFNREPNNNFGWEQRSY